MPPFRFTPSPTFGDSSFKGMHIEHEIFIVGNAFIANSPSIMHCGKD